MPGDSSVSSFARLPQELDVSEEGMSVKWKLWKQSFDFYSTAVQLTGKAPEVQVAVFMSAIGPAAIVIFNTFGLTDEEKKNLSVIQQKFDDYFSPKPNETFTRYLFFSCMQGKQETFDSYYTKLKTKVSDCCFGLLQDSLLRDQVVRGICSDKVREMLLAERELTLSKAIDICRASEQATNQLKEMHASDSLDKEVLSVKCSKSKSKLEKYKQTKLCWRCNLSHDFGKCPAFNVNCRKCNKKGHYARQCKFNVKQSYVHKTRMHEILEEESSNVDDLSCDTLNIGELLDNIGKETNIKAWFTTIEFEKGYSVKFKLDTGAEADVIMKSIVDKLSLPVKKSRVRRLRSFSNGCIPVVGEVVANCIINNQSVKLKLIVVDGDFSCILGCKTCEELGLIKRNVDLIELNEVKINIPEKIFDGIGCIKNFEYEIEFQEGANFAKSPGSEIPIPDALSRDCTVHALELSSEYEETETFEVVLDLPLPMTTFSELVSAVNEDNELQQLKSIIMQGWPETIMEVPEIIRKYWNYREELSSYENLLFKAERLIVPKQLRYKYLKYIHHGHLGINLSLQRAREIVFWHGMTKDIENYVQQCVVCQQTSAPKTEPLIMKPVPQFPWQRVATDLFELAGKTYCLIVDSYSGFFDFKKLDHPNSENVINYLKDSFATHGIPDVLESDNGPQYRSELFRIFTRDWKIKHQTSSPNYPKSNGLAERHVQIAKLILKRCKIERSDYRLALLNWRNTPRQDLPSPAERLFGRPTRALIPLHPARRLPRTSSTVPLQVVREKQRQNSTTSSKRCSPYFVEGDVVKLKTEHRKWVPATVVSSTEAPRSYVVSTPEGKTYRRNTEVIRHTKAAISPDREVVINPASSSSPSVRQSPVPSSNSRVESPPLKRNSMLPVSHSNLVKTRSGRIVRPPDRLNYS